MRPILLLATLLAGCATASERAASPRDIHERLLTLDTHLDTPTHFGRRGWNIAERHTVATDMSEVDLPRMREGGLDGGFWVIYTPQGPLTAEGYGAARAYALNRSDEILAVVRANSGAMQLATRADEAEAIARTGKRIVYKAIENSYPLGEDLSLLTEFYRRGVRMAGPVHSRDNQFADSTTGEKRWGGLSPLGRQWVLEMNRLGMVIDASHASDAAFDQMLALSTTPLILSHSGPRALHNHPRNIDDARLKALAAKGGVIQVNSIFLAERRSSPERDALEAREQNFKTMRPAEQRALAAEFAALDERSPLEDTDFEDFMASLLYLLKLVGPDHVGLGADWDGGGGVRGMEDVSFLPKVTERLLAAGYSEADLAKIWSGNTLRVLRAAELAARPAA